LIYVILVIDILCVMRAGDKKRIQVS